MKTVSSCSYIHIGPSKLLALWISGFNFATLDIVRRTFSQLKHGEARLIDGVVFKKQHNDIVVITVQRRVYDTKKKSLLFALIDMITYGKTAFEISTLHKDS